MDEKKYMTVREVADYMGVSHTAVYNWMKQGLTGKTEKVIGLKTRVVFTVEDLQRYFGVEDIENIRRKKR